MIRISRRHGTVPAGSGLAQNWGMRVEVLSDHPADLLASAAQARGAGTGGSLGRVGREIGRERDAARRGGRWLAWLRLSFARWRAKRAAARSTVSASTVSASGAPTGSEEAMRAGSGAEQRVADELGRALGQEWVLFRGYRNGRGEIDGVLLGPGGLFAYEVKYHNATVYISGDAWAGEKYDNYGNLVEPRRPIIDRGSRGRSPSQQLNEPASALAAWLSRRGHPVDIARVVLLTHPKARIGVSNEATVRVVTSAAALLRLVQGSGARLGARQRAEIEQVIRRDHQHFNGSKR
jgi:hypothetical protein